MFKCDVCGKNSRPGEKQTLQVVETRKVDYADASGKVVGHGRETVREIRVCEKCL